LIENLLTNRYHKRGVPINIKTVITELSNMTGSVSSIPSVDGKRLRRDKAGITYKIKNTNKIASRARMCAGFLMLKSMKL
jgi:hypothetical protein